MATKQESKKYLLAIDPGLLTGMALIDVTDSMNPFPVWSSEEDVRNFYKLTEETVIKYQNCLEVVIEKFIITPETAKKSQAPWSLKGWGAVEMVCMKFGVMLTVQTPSDAKNFVPEDNKMLHHIGWWHVGGDGHANDAFRHAIKYHADGNPKWAKKLII